MKKPIHRFLRALIVATSLTVGVSPVSAATGAELLEKGIYNEETKGDLDSAITIYQQLIADAKAAQAQAAEAQFRLGNCYLKKNRTAEATSAFEKLIRDYPQEKELVAKARKHLPSELALQPIPWVDGERLQMVLTVGNGVDIGTVEYRAVLASSNGRQIWRVGSRMFAGGNSLSSVDADTESFAPISSTWKHALLGDATATYRAGEVEMARAGKDPIKMAIQTTVYDNEQAMYLMRRLPLEVGYKATVQIASSLSGAGMPIPIDVEVKAKELVEVPAGKFECFKVVLSIGQTFWISVDQHRYMAKFEAGGAIAALTSISQRKASDPVAFQDSILGVSLTAPADWVIHRNANHRDDQKIVHLLDPDMHVDAFQVRIHATENLSAVARNSAKNWAESDFAESIPNELKDATLRADGWKNYTVNGRPGVSFTADYTDGDRRMAALFLYALGTKTSEVFMLKCAADKLDAVRPAFESIVASYRSK